MKSAGRRTITGTIAKSRSADLATAVSLPLPRVVVLQDEPLRLGILAARDDVDTREHDPLAWLELRYPGRRPDPNAAPFYNLARKHFSTEPGGAAGATESFFRDDDRAEALRALARFYAKGIPFRPPAGREVFASAEVERMVARGKNESRARVLGKTQVELPPIGKLQDVRYLRACVRNRVSEVYTFRSACRKCGRRRHSRQGVDFYVRPGEDGRELVSHEGVVRCGSVWSCASCAARISSTRAELLKQIIGAHRSTGGGVYMLTLTFPHTRALACKTARRVKSAAWKLFQQGSPWPRAKARMGYVGSVASTEVTHGVNGWHVHLHILLATRATLSDGERSELEDRLFLQWESAVARQDVARVAAPTREHGVKLTPCHDESYIAKLGLADELTGALYKVARDGNRTIFQIMADYFRTRSAYDGALLREFYLAMRGARQLTFSRGKDGATDLRKIYPPNVADPLQLALLDGEEMNADVLAADDKDGRHVAYVAPGQWDALVRVYRAARSDAGAELTLAIEEHGGAVGLGTVLDDAYKLAVVLVKRRPHLRRWVWWLDPQRRALTSPVAGVDAPMMRTSSVTNAGEGLHHLQR